MDNETNASKTEDWIKVLQAMEQEAEEERYEHVRRCMAYQKSLKQPVEKWEKEIWDKLSEESAKCTLKRIKTFDPWETTQKAQQEARETGEGV